MIVDRIENCRLYAPLSANLKKAFELLQDKSVLKQPDGRYEVSDDIYYIVVRYQTKPASEAKLEAHKKYLDVQFVAAGEELIGFAPTSRLQIQTPYDKEKDFMLYNVPEKLSSLSLLQGMFSIFYPHDAHMPACQLNGPADVHKIVVKVKTN